MKFLRGDGASKRLAVVGLCSPLHPVCLGREIPVQTVLASLRFRSKPACLGMMMRRWAPRGIVRAGAPAGWQTLREQIPNRNLEAFLRVYTAMLDDAFRYGLGDDGPGGPADSMWTEAERQAEEGLQASIKVLIEKEAPFAKEPEEVFDSIWDIVMEELDFSRSRKSACAHRFY